MVTVDPKVVSDDRLKQNEYMMKEVLRVLEGHVGETEAITIATLWRQYFPSLKTDRAIRQAFSDLIEAGHPICYKSGVGHYWPATEQDAIECANHEYGTRALDLFLKRRILKHNAYKYFHQAKQPGLL